MAKVTLARLEELKRRAMERAPGRYGCACCYVDIVEGEMMSTEARKQVEANVLCFARHKLRPRHVGFSTIIIVPPQHSGAIEEDDAPHRLC
jgi:hypothetical protein